MSNDTGRQSYVVHRSSVSPDGTKDNVDQATGNSCVLILERWQANDRGFASVDARVF